MVKGWEKGCKNSVDPAWLLTQPLLISDHTWANVHLMLASHSRTDFLDAASLSAPPLDREEVNMLLDSFQTLMQRRFGTVIIENLQRWQARVDVEPEPVIKSLIMAVGLLGELADSVYDGVREDDHMPRLGQLCESAIQHTLRHQGLVRFQKVKAAIGKAGLVYSELPFSRFLSEWAKAETSGSPAQVLKRESRHLKGWSEFFGLQTETNKWGRAFISFLILKAAGFGAAVQAGKSENGPLMLPGLQLPQLSSPDISPKLQER